MLEYNMAQEELLIKLSLMEQQSEEAKKQIEQVEEQIKDLEALKLSLEKLGHGKEKDKEMLANLGRGIFLNTKINDNKVFVNVGSKILVRRSFPEAAEIINKQISELQEIKHQIMHNIDAINSNLQELVEEARRQN